MCSIDCPIVYRLSILSYSRCNMYYIYNHNIIRHIGHFHAAQYYNTTITGKGKVSIVNFISETNIEGVNSMYIHFKRLDANIHPGPNLTKPTFELRHRLIITTHRNLWRQLITHALIPVNICYRNVSHMLCCKFHKLCINITHSVIYNAVLNTGVLGLHASVQNTPHCLVQNLGLWSLKFFMLQSMLCDRDHLTWLLIGLRLCCQPTRSQV